MLTFHNTALGECHMLSSIFTTDEKVLLAETAQNYVGPSNQVHLLSCYTLQI